MTLRLCRGLLVVLALVSFGVSSGSGQSGGPKRDSGRAFLSPELQSLESDDGSNPGMLWVEQGAKLWERIDGAPPKSCMGCHARAEDTMRGVAARYPAFDDKAARVLNLELKINQCRTERMRVPAFPYESGELVSLTAFVAHQSRGSHVSVRTDGPATASYADGKQQFHQRQGQLNLACSQCHEDNVGKHLRGDRISHGLGNAYPIYRLEWQSAGSLHRRLRSCAVGVRAVEPVAGSPEHIALELYLAWRAQGLPVETPGVRR